MEQKFYSSLSQDTDRSREELALLCKLAAMNCGIIHSLREMKDISQELEEEAAQKVKRFLAGRQVAWMIYEYLKVSGTDESV